MAFKEVIAVIKRLLSHLSTGWPIRILLSLKATVKSKIHKHFGVSNSQLQKSTRRYTSPRSLCCQSWTAWVSSGVPSRLKGTGREWNMKLMRLRVVYIEVESRSCIEVSNECSNQLDMVWCAGSDITTYIYIIYSMISLFWNSWNSWCRAGCSAVNVKMRKSWTCSI